MLQSEIYYPDEIYETMAGYIRVALKATASMPAEERENDLKTAANVVRLLPTIDGSFATHIEIDALAAALIAYQPIVSGGFDTRDVRWLLGQAAGVFPERVRNL